ncbi:MAG: LicD family protein [Eubacterium sp.]|nr:LicD family protein [Eubacterium sp.]
MNKYDKETYNYIYSDRELLQVKRISLEMAKLFWQFCKENGLLAFLCRGSCIGALRKGGFIPWDDDIDFFMPRRDYMRFLRLWPDYDPGRRYALSIHSKDFTDRNAYATLRDRRTTMIRPYQKDLDLVHGVALDIMPLDGYPDDSGSRKKQMRWAHIYLLFSEEKVPENSSRFMRIAGPMLLGLFRGRRMRYRFIKYSQKMMSAYKIGKCEGVTELCSGVAYRNNWYDKVWFNTYREVPFENTLLPVPAGAEDYLLTAFGDYTILPPEEERIAQRDIVYLDLEKPYQDYHGKYYCVNREPKHKRKEWVD